MVLVEHRKVHARGMMVAGVAEGRLYHVNLKTGLLHLCLGGGAVQEEPGCHPDDVEEYRQFESEFEVKSARKTPPPPPKKAPAPQADPEPEPAEPTEEDPDTESADGGDSESDDPTPDLSEDEETSPPAFPEIDSMSIKEWLIWTEEQGLELEDDQKAVRPKADLIDLIRELYEARE